MRIQNDKVVLNARETSSFLNRGRFCQKVLTESRNRGGLEIVGSDGEGCGLVLKKSRTTDEILDGLLNLGF